MRNKLTFSLILTGILLLVTVVIVSAGASIDYGQVRNIDGIETPPPEGTVNWTAWNQSLIDFGVVNIPEEILTEDNTNCINGEDIGYSDMGYEEDGTTDPYAEWWILMQNFDEPDPSTLFNKYNVILGGLGETYSGTLWETSFAWVNTESQTNHGVVEISSTLPPNPCPRISTQPIEEPINTSDGRSFYFVGQPNSTYYVYRSQLGSGASNGASNGRYYYLNMVESNEDGIGIYTDFEVYDGPSWYLVIQADPGTGAIIGCHSEEGDPTNVVMGDFTAVYDDEKSAVMLEWETVSETNIVGFNVFRDTNDTLVASVKINTEIIPAKQSGSPVGNIYTFEDADIENGHTYYYWIEILTNDMSDQTVGPESVTIPEPAWFYYFLPLLFN